MAVLEEAAFCWPFICTLY